MKIHQLDPHRARSSQRVDRVTALGTPELRKVSAGVAPFSCAFVEYPDTGPTISYHDGYPR